MKERPCLFLATDLLLIAFNAILPLMTVVNYSLHKLVPGSQPEYAGLENYRTLLHCPAPAKDGGGESVKGKDEALQAWLEEEVQNAPSPIGEEWMGALGRQILFSGLVLLIEIPLGLAVALCLPRRGWGLTASLVLLGIPLLIPWNIVGMVWRVFTRPDIGVVAPFMARLGWDYQPATVPADGWWTTVAMDVWHWTPLVVFLCLAGLRAIPEPYFRAAEIDGASPWSAFRHVVLPKLRYVLIVAVLMRVMDSLNIFTEPFILTGGGPGSTTTFMSFFIHNLKDTKGLLAAASVLYLYLVVMVCFFLYTAMRRAGEGAIQR
jgi:glycerol transport system permease protein